MRIEALADTRGTGLSNRAFELARSLRTPVRPPSRNAGTATDSPQREAAPRTPGADRGPAVDTSVSTAHVTTALAAASVLAATATVQQLRSDVVRPPVLDNDGDGWVNEYDLPFDFFQIARQATVRTSDRPVEQPA